MRNPQISFRRIKPTNEQRIVQRRIKFNPLYDPMKPRYASISNMVRTFYSLEELQQEYDKANSKEEEEILG